MGLFDYYLNQQWFLKTSLLSLKIFFLGVLEKKLQRTLLKKDRDYEVNI
jgi:hypothetical protein